MKRREALIGGNMRQISWIVAIICSLLVGCSGLKDSEQKKLRSRNATLIPIKEIESPPPFSLDSSPKSPPTYPWASKWIGSQRKINEEFFRCQGSSSHPPIRLNDTLYRDCNGIDDHSLPTQKMRPFVYQVLIKLLNYLQEVSGKKVVITCGHCCPRHNTYINPSLSQRTSKHQIAAEVDFYVEGMEHEPEQIVDLLLSYYANQVGPSSERFFFRSKRADVRTPCWKNREIKITLSHLDERRDRDNAHSYPYLTLEVLYDKAAKRSVSYSWQRAHKSCFRR